MPTLVTVNDKRPTVYGDEATRLLEQEACKEQGLTTITYYWFKQLFTAAVGLAVLFGGIYWILYCSNK